MVLADSLIIFLVITGCVCCVLMGYSIHFIATNGFVDEKDREMTFDQKQYMRQLRQRNLHWMFRDARVRRDVETPMDPVHYAPEESVQGE
ncbi:hypothetical protein AOCH_003012 [Aspergillus ochraceoroseus]|nr:hypothetical protein AOCH_003012 [Aspergillus ochraceoroseus]